MAKKKRTEVVTEGTPRGEDVFGRGGIGAASRASTGAVNIGDAGAAPKLVRRAGNRKTSFKSGRTIAEKREKLETANERTAAREKVKRRARTRVFFTVVLFLICAGVLVLIMRVFIKEDEESGYRPATVVVSYAPTVEVFDAGTGTVASGLSNRMKEYIGQAEVDFRELGYTPTRVVIPEGAIREVDFYLEGYNGFIKMILDRGTGVSVEDADRMIRYLAGISVSEFEYIDVRVEGNGYWK